MTLIIGKALEYKRKQYLSLGYSTFSRDLAFRIFLANDAIAHITNVTAMILNRERRSSFLLNELFLINCFAQIIWFGTLNDHKPFNSLMVWRIKTESNIYTKYIICEKIVKLRFTVG